MNISDVFSRTAAIVAFAFASILSPIASARLFDPWSFEQLSAKSDLIAIIEAIRDDPATDSFKADSDKFVGVNTRFRVHAVLKGQFKGKELTVLHFFDETPVINGPMSADFRFTWTYKEQFFLNGKAAASAESGPNPRTPIWLAFLKARPDGRFEPVTGQYDSELSFCKLIDSTPHRTEE
jgi:hypothetical protein